MISIFLDVKIIFNTDVTKKVFLDRIIELQNDINKYFSKFKEHAVDLEPGIESTIITGKASLVIIEDYIKGHEFTSLFNHDITEVAKVDGNEVLVLRYGHRDWVHYDIEDKQFLKAIALFVKADIDSTMRKTENCTFTSQYYTQVEGSDTKIYFDTLDELKATGIFGQNRK